MDFYFKQSSKESIVHQNNERIVGLLYRRLKGLPITAEELKDLQDWLDTSESNRRIMENLSDQKWLKEARKRYYAPGKEEGLRQLRAQLFNEPIRKPWYKRLFDSLVPVIPNK